MATLTLASTSLERSTARAPSPMLMGLCTRVGGYQMSFMALDALIPSKGGLTKVSIAFNIIDILSKVSSKVCGKITFHRVTASS